MTKTRRAYEHALGKPLRAIWLEADEVVLIDQTKLPFKEEHQTCRSYVALAEAILEMRVRGSGSLRVAGALGMVLAAIEAPGTGDRASARLKRAAAVLKRTRPTAVKLFRGIDQVWHAASQALSSKGDIVGACKAEASRIMREEEETSLAISQIGASLIGSGATVLTHCHTGGLATPGYGTALGAIKMAWWQNKGIEIIATESRPFMQGALTAWELGKAGIPVTLIVDSAASYLMKTGKVDVVIVGSDRVAADGSLANKIGTYGLAIAAHAHRVPFYSTVPTETIDPATPTGEEIAIEERDEMEVLSFAGANVTPGNARALNPSFDVTPPQYISAFVTEKGVFRPSEILRALTARKPTQRRREAVVADNTTRTPRSRGR